MLQFSFILNILLQNGHENHQCERTFDALDLSEINVFVQRSLLRGYSSFFQLSLLSKLFSYILLTYIVEWGDQNALFELSLIIYDGPFSSILICCLAEIRRLYKC